MWKPLYMCYLPLERQVALTVWQIPDAVDTVVCAPDDGWRYHPKHVERFPDTGCPTTYQTRHLFNNSKTNEDIATRFEQEYVRCVRNEEECVCSVCLFRCNICIGFRIIKEMPGLGGSGTPYINKLCKVASCWIHIGIHILRWEGFWFQSRMGAPSNVSYTD